MRDIKNTEDTFMKKTSALARIIDAIRTPKTITYNIYIDKHDVPTLGTPIKAQPKADTSEAYDYFKPF